tara:strand:- start:565 stop:849 length:285 start_codon:yes stop_codon:yes gene_type:complete
MAATSIKTTEDFLREAMVNTSDTRQKQHGDKAKNHANISALWSWYLKKEVSAYDVAMMMALLKIARTKTGSPNKDDLVDGAAYLAIAGELRFDE